jgi:hypothetical protein
MGIWMMVSRAHRSSIFGHHLSNLSLCITAEGPLKYELFPLRKYGGVHLSCTLTRQINSITVANKSPAEAVGSCFEMVYFILFFEKASNLGGGRGLPPMAAIQKRRTELRHELTQLEKQIYDLETTYLEETKEIGNIFTGWSAYISPSKEKVKIRKQILNEDRLFSLSSVTSPAARTEAKKVGL